MGLMSRTPTHLNIERMCERVTDSQYHQIQHFIGESPWQWRPAFDSVAKEISDAIADVGKVGLLIDESSHLKKEEKSVGVAWEEVVVRQRTKGVLRYMTHVR